MYIAVMLAINGHIRFSVFYAKLSRFFRSIHKACINSGHLTSRNILFLRHIPAHCRPRLIKRLKKTHGRTHCTCHHHIIHQTFILLVHVKRGQVHRLILIELLKKRRHLRTDMSTVNFGTHTKGSQNSSRRTGFSSRKKILRLKLRVLVRLHKFTLQQKHMGPQYLSVHVHIVTHKTTS